jgi:methionine-rich copper-binding protein CopC
MNGEVGDVWLTVFVLWVLLVRRRRAHADLTARSPHKSVVTAQVSGLQIRSSGSASASSREVINA